MAAVAALHEAKIVHADLKPANVYLVRILASAQATN